MKKFTLLLTAFFAVCIQTFAQNKILIGIVPFKGTSSNTNTNQYSYYNSNRQTSSTDEHITAIQDVVTNAFLKVKRFSLVEREKMDQIKSEKELQKNEDFIDGQVIEQSKSLGAQYIVTGNVSKAVSEEKTSNVPYVGSVTNYVAEIAFSVRVIDVTTGEIVASNSFDKTGKGKNAFADALKDIEPEIEKFIRDNFKITASVVSIEEKNKKGEAVKVLISAGSSSGIVVNNKFKVQEISEITVEGKTLARKKQIGVIVVANVEDENFSVCNVVEGGADITKKIEAGQKIKCEPINE